MRLLLEAFNSPERQPTLMHMHIHIGICICPCLSIRMYFVCTYSQLVAGHSRSRPRPAKMSNRTPCSGGEILNPKPYGPLKVDGIGGIW